ncbi:hypothetical protein K491DRAFT_348315 [Lophiostoma macrostomum CBS 122681]|uniref:Uncharacterized protein n=1 Tax=Lophiostoma macrostomum CBS 122681 TaxID=1314788 RepID=A0A6A6TB53_9PLEO|nr:hypothetical protein K491DRAFT_348315 [Lophiostoma macrostomum CBS 122681]
MARGQLCCLQAASLTVCPSIGCLDPHIQNPSNSDVHGCLFLKYDGAYRNWPSSSPINDHLTCLSSMLYARCWRAARPEWRTFRCHRVRRQTTGRPSPFIDHRSSTHDVGGVIDGLEVSLNVRALPLSTTLGLVVVPLGFSRSALEPHTVITPPSPYPTSNLRKPYLRSMPRRLFQLW